MDYLRLVTFVSLRTTVRVSEWKRVEGSALSDRSTRCKWLTQKLERTGAVAAVAWRLCRVYPLRYLTHKRIQATSSSRLIIYILTESNEISRRMPLLTSFQS